MPFNSPQQHDEQHECSKRHMETMKTGQQKEC